MKDFIFEKFENKLENENDIDNIIKLIDCLEGKDAVKENKYEEDKKNEIIIIEFLNRLMKNNLFNKNEFLSSNPNLKIDLLIKVYKEEKFQRLMKNIMKILGAI